MPQVLRSRLPRRLLCHHLPLLLLSTSAVVALYATRPYQDAMTRASFATAYPALTLLCATLITGPWNVIRKKTNPVSSDLRRDIGIWAGLLGVLHSVIGQCVHLRGRPWLYYIYGSNKHHSFPLRHDLFGIANYTGAIATLILCALLATSNDYFLRILHTRPWKQLQRMNYAVFGLTAMHTIGYLSIERQKTNFVAAVAISLFLTLAFQAAGLARRLQSRISPDGRFTA